MARPAPAAGLGVTALVTARRRAHPVLGARLSRRGKIFDEVYYATEAQELLRFGYEDNRGYMFIVHPPLGKWLIGLSVLDCGATTAHRLARRPGAGRHPRA